MSFFSTWMTFAGVNSLGKKTGVRIVGRRNARTPSKEDRIRYNSVRAVGKSALHKKVRRQMARDSRRINRGVS